MEEQASNILSMIDKFLFGDTTYTWKEKRDIILNVADKQDCRESFDEFLNWFGGTCMEDD